MKVIRGWSVAAAFALIVAGGFMLPSCGNDNSLPFVPVQNTGWHILDHPDAIQTSPMGISGDRVVGIYYPKGGGSHGFLYNGATWTDLDYPGALYTEAMGVSGNKIVGSYYSDPAAQFYHGFVYDGTTWKTLDYPGAVGTHIFGINGDTIVGYYWDGTSDHGFIYNGSTWSSIDYPKASQTYVNGVSGSTMVGDCELDVSRGFLYNGSSFTLLNYPPATGDMRVWSISGDTVVGHFQTSTTVTHGFIHSIKNSSWTILDYPGATWTDLRGIDNGKIVGSFNLQGTTHGFLYITDSGL